MSAERLELSTNGLKGHCSTIELRARSGLHSNTPPITRQFERSTWSNSSKSTREVKSRLSGVTETCRFECTT